MIGKRSSQNNGDWITGLIEDYKYVDGVHFGERKHWLQDDYVKFIRFAESMIAKNGEGVLGFITNHGYLDNPTFRGMRWHLMNTFDRIYVLDLHGNANKREVGPDGLIDKNVFDIRQGVAIVIAVKHRGRKAVLAEVRHKHLWGKREAKYQTLWVDCLASDGSTKLKPRKPYFMFYPANLVALDQYDKGFSIASLFQAQSTGIISARDDFAVAFDAAELEGRARVFLDDARSDDDVRAHFFGIKSGKKYKAGDSRGWRLTEKRPILQTRNPRNKFRSIHYRPFDYRTLWYDADIVDWPRIETMGTFREGANLSILTPRMTADEYSPLVSDKIISNKTGSRYDQTYFFPIYVETGDGELTGDTRLNYRPKLYAKIRAAAGLAGPIPAPDPATVTSGGFRTATGDARPDEVKVFDYIYGVLHCPAYRETYAEFLKIDFPRVPFPPSPEVFAAISQQGEALRRLHLMEDAAIGPASYPFCGEGDSVVDKPRYEPQPDGTGRVYINGKGSADGSGGQYFDAVPAVSWGFPIGGYQPAQKWLKDRKGRALSWDDIRHYQKIIKILSETDRIMRGIAMPLGEGGE